MFQCEDEDVVQVHTYMPLHDKVLKDFIHHGLECGRGVRESKEHDQGFKESTISAKHCFPLITFLDVNIVITPPDIKLGKVSCTLELIYKFRNDRQWVVVLHCHHIECMVVLDQAKQTIFLLNKKHRQGHW